MTNYTAKFQDAFDSLNPKQRQAVEQIYGPVMTLAGPGTGKTQLLTVRIGHILKETDTDIRNIICLTFTDAGAHAMRKRLHSFIGPDSYNANIYTFHSFCNDVIKSNPEAFGGYRELQLVSDLELVDVFREIIDSRDDDHPMKKYKGQLYSDVDRMRNLYATMKQEGWTAEDLATAVDGLEAYYKNPDNEKVYESMHYKRKTTTKGVTYQKGDFKQNALDKAVAKFDNLLAAAKEITAYNDILKRIGRFDYHDMIQWVIDAFKTNADLLADYQERYQFILVDEYQDTNGTQNELIFLLADNEFHDQPNLFIVGDDDQAIYRFQGANMQNIQMFEKKYEPKVIVLEDNYRSYQGILDRATQLINNNKQRLSGQGKMSKELRERRALKIQTGVDPIFQRYKNVSQEEYSCIKQILDLRKQGVALDEIAVIYRKHKNVDNIIKYLSLHNVPLNIKKKVDVLKEMDVLRLVNILEYLKTEYKKPYMGNHLIFEILHYDFFELSMRDIGLISLYCSRRTDDIYDDKMYMDVLSTESHLKAAGVTHVDQILKISGLLDGWLSMIPNVTLQVLFEQILTQSGLLDQVLRSEDTGWRLQVINTFFNLIKDESDREENFTLADLMSMHEKMKEHKLSLPINKVTTSEKGVHFLTTHGSKGLEFRYVFMIRCEQSNWVKRGNNFTFSFPPTLTHRAGEGDIEDERRLFYVGMTRAKDKLYITHSEKDEKDKDLTPALFVTEILRDIEEVDEVNLTDVEMLSYKADLMRYKQGSVEIIDHDLIDRVLRKYQVSSTSLNKYLKCPVTFYFENILRVPMARSAPMGFGNAIHHALEQFFIVMEKDPQRNIPPSKLLVQLFQEGMRRYHSHFTKQERALSTTRGEKLLTGYHETYKGKWSAARGFEMERKITTESNGVPITGKIDRMEIYDDHLVVIDYKTGKYDSKKLKGPTGDEDHGGDYWRQIIFYKMLLDGDIKYAGRRMNGVMDYVEPDQKTGNYRQVRFDVEIFEVEIVKKQLAEAYQGITEHKFDKGCDDEKCTWCNFVKDNLPVTLSAMDEDNPEEAEILEL